jgi:hypothetical protein
MIDLSRRALPTMFRASQHEFGFTMRGTAQGQNPRLEGVSVRYGAIVLLGATYLEESSQRKIFGGETAEQFCGRLIAECDSITNLGDVALIAWAAALMGHSQLERAFDALRRRWADLTDGYTVEVAWALSALAQARGAIREADWTEQVQQKVMEAFDARGGMFGHYVGPRRGSRGIRGHVGCFADQVYPIQALSRFHHFCGGDEQSLAVASQCAAQICRLQGDAGQWWWHYDMRTGRVTEGYPVYSVHQNSMAPMALLDLLEAGGPDHSDAIRRGLLWMKVAPEVGRSLIDEDQLVIWRKVARKDPKKLMRRIRATTSWVHPALRLGWLNAVFPPSGIDFECRPYHLGWVLHAWLGRL